MNLIILPKTFKAFSHKMKFVLKQSLNLLNENYRKEITYNLKKVVQKARTFVLSI